MDSRDPSKTWSIRQIVGLAFQNPDNQIVGTVVDEDIAFGLENLGIPSAEIKRRVEWALEKVRMLDYRNHPPHMLSGGQKQRVAIAGILAMKPRCIVLDEPTSLLDPKGRTEVRQLLLELNREGITIILITHLIDEALLAKRVLVLDQGKIAMLGTPEEVLSRTEELRAYHLEPPLSVRLAQNLVANGIMLPKKAMTIRELKDILCALKSRM
jgi:energy-coupling factor transporter ATPase